MKRSGRISLLLITVVLAVAAAVVLIFFASGDSPTGAASRFMSALGRADVDELTNLTYMPDTGKEDIRKKWEYTTKIAKFYRFATRYSRTNEVSDEEATVRFDVVRNYLDPGRYEQPFEIPMVRHDGHWLVDVRGISREMYPALPR